jgi:hypothetical protein
VISLPAADAPSFIHRPKTGQETAKPKEYNMKRIILASALVAASAFGAVAQNAPVMLSSAIQSEILTLIPGADLSNLTNAQYAQLVTFFTDSENTRTASGTAQGVKAILNAQ